MPREWNSTLFDFARVEGHAIAAGFDSGRITSDAGAFLLGAIKRVVGPAAALPPLQSAMPATRCTTRVSTACLVKGGSRLS